jgi:cephalosporin hydroxylase/SAM-dependent methyltransferase
VTRDDETARTSDGAAERATRRYLDLLKRALLDEHYIENELRIEHLMEHADSGTQADLGTLADPARHMPVALKRLRREREVGEHPPSHPATAPRRTALAYADVGRARLDHLERLLEMLRAQNVAGDLVDCPAGRGGAAIFMRGYLEARERSGVRVWVADRFRTASNGGATARLALPSDLNTLREGFARFDLLDDRVVFLQGEPAPELAAAGPDAIAMLRVDGNDADEIRAVLDVAYDRVAPGGFVVIDDYGAPDCQAAVDSFRSGRGVAEPLERVDSSAAAWRKRPENGPVSALSPPRTTTKDLSVVAVFHNMRREAARTLHSLSRSYQQGIEGVDYEVIAVENGSDPNQALGKEFVTGFGPEFRYLDLGGDATPSPARAVNRGIAASSGRAVAVMIDGAHLLTPGVLRLGLLGFSTYAPAVVTARHWYLGPGQQPRTLAAGYDREAEDRLLDQIDWPTDGYRLFEISHPVGARDWFDGEWESNCIIVPRALIDQVGGMDEAYAMPGGGFVNLDLYERMVSSPGINLVTLLGEASFHQVHGGTTTNLTRHDERQDLIRAYEDHYRELRGRRFRVPTQRAHYIGSLPPPARRTRRRRMGAKQFRAAHPLDRRPSRPVPVPDELKVEFNEAFWRSGEWHRTPWLGKSAHRPPTDLFAYQELIARLRPEWVVETRTGSGGRAWFLATICDLIGEGRVLSIDDDPDPDRPEHPRITYLTGDPAAERTASEVRELAGESPRALVILGGSGTPQLTAAFRNFAPLVPPGSYVVVEDTILDGAQAWPAFGSGPMGAVAEIVDELDFIPDPDLERYGISFNGGGFLKRVR